MMSDILYAYTPEAVEALRVVGPVVRGIILDGGVVVAAQEPERSFEAWCVERWRREIESEAFRATAEYEYLRAQWERERYVRETRP